MNVVDSSAWLAYFAGNANAEHFALAIEDQDQLLVPAITLIEVFKIIFKQRGEAPALIAVAHMRTGQVISLDATLAMDAATLGLRHKLPLADSIIYATTAKYRARLWTQGEDFKGLPQVEYFPTDSVI